MTASPAFLAHGLRDKCSSWLCAIKYISINQTVFIGCEGRRLPYDAAMRTKPTAWLIVSLFGGVLGGTFGAVQAGVRINLSPSMPKGLYRLVHCDETAGRDAAVGDWVAIDTEEASSNPGLAFFRTLGWLSYSGRSDDLLMKTIVAVGGDEVTEKDGRLCVNGRPLAKSASRRQRTVGSLALPSVELPQRIKAGEVWVSSDHEKGIDSRYFGAVARSSIACKAEAVWIL
jgi:type IV secretory pathway protease TraF